MTYPIVEARMSREQASKTLGRICERLDACSSASFENRYYKRGAPQLRTVQRLWVVGSYARGAMTCGDIDIVMELDSSHYRVAELNRVFLKNPQRVSLYVGTPEDNTSGVEFPEARLIWEAGKSWQALLDAIALDPAAMRFSRLTDSIPVRMGQLSRCSLEWAESAALRKEAGELDWEFLPLDEVTAGMELSERSPLARNERLYLSAQSRGVGVKGRQLLPYLEAYARRFEQSSHYWLFDSRTHIRHGRTLFVLGTTPRLEELDVPGIAKIVVMPHLNARGPNGYWVVTRGKQHPLVKAFEGREAWLITDEKDQPLVTGWSSCMRPTRWVGATVDAFNIFTSEAHALEALEEGGSCSSLGEDDVRQVRHIKGEDFQMVIDGCHMLDGGLCWTVFSEEGLWRSHNAGFSDEELTVCSIEELAEMFPLEADVTSHTLKMAA